MYLYFNILKKDLCESLKLMYHRKYLTYYLIFLLISAFDSDNFDEASSSDEDEDDSDSDGEKKKKKKTKVTIVILCPVWKLSLQTRLFFIFS